jgi:hypothetical protein
MLNPFDAAGVAACAATGVTAFALESLPRISRAQSMDVLSSQANIAGYKAVMLAANLYARFMPMLMTAAGTVKAARVLIIGVGVAGLQAIATAKRLGAVIEATDVRPSVKDQVESLGAKWVDVPYANDEERKIAEGVGGYARPMPPEWMARQSSIIAERCKVVDILITTALIPGRPAPKLIKADTVASMKPGAVIVDLAVEQGGNVEGSEAGKVVERNGVKIDYHPEPEGVHDLAWWPALKPDIEKFVVDQIRCIGRDRYNDRRWNLCPVLSHRHSNASASSSLLVESQLDYLSSARLLGEKSPHIMFVEILPNVVPAILVEFTVRLGYAVFAVATLSFLGFGIQPPTPDWGADIAANYGVLPAGYWWSTIFPALAIASLVVGVNLVTDSIEQVLAS